MVISAEARFIEVVSVVDRILIPKLLWLTLGRAAPRIGSPDPAGGCPPDRPSPHWDGRTDLTVTSNKYRNNALKTWLQDKPFPSISQALWCHT